MIKVHNTLVTCSSHLKSIHSYNIRAAANNFRPPVSNLTYGLRSFSQYGCKIWNSLPKDIQATKSLEFLKKI